VNIESRILLLASILTLAWSPANGQTTEPPTSALSISITAQDHVKTGSDVKVEIAVTNNSDHEIKYDAFGAGTASRTDLDVRDADRHPASAASKPREQSSSPPAKPGEGRAGGYYSGPSSYIRIGSGKTIHLERVISKEFDLSKPGKYTVQLAHQLDGTIVKSNTITLMVTP
jgi:hypothetical protein